MTHTLELPEAVYQGLVEAAQATGTTPADWIAKRLPIESKPVSDDERQASNLRLRQSRVASGRPSGIDNEGIDADLAREYGDDHASLYEPKVDR